jgi:hypothetical protein
MNVDQIASEALDLEDPAAREAYLDDACGSDAELRTQVDALLHALERTDQSEFLASGLFGNRAADPPANASASEPHPGQDRFRLRSQHAVGGLGEVWLAWDRQLNREVALKRIRSEWVQHPEANARFRREAEITGFLEHPGIVPIYSLGDDENGRPFYAMQFVHGRTLQEVVAQHIDVPDKVDSKTTPPAGDRWYDFTTLRELLNHFVDVCQTIDYAHSREVVHRDLKPSNIMLGAYGQTLVVDWGLSKRIDAAGMGLMAGDSSFATMPDPLTEVHTLASQQDSSVDETRQGTAMGTPRYMSPEQAAGKIDQIGPAADIYGLGATLYFILTGQPPHVGEADLKSTFERIVQGRFDPPARIRSEVPRPLQAIVMKAMATKPGGRYVTAGLLAEDIENYLGDQPISVFHDPPIERLLRWTRKHPAASAAAAVGLLLLIVGSASGLLVWQEMDRRDLLAARQRSQSEARIRFQEDTRRLEAVAAADAAIRRSEAALRDSRYADAAALIGVAIDRIKDQPSLAERADSLIERRDRLRRLGTFNELRTRGEDLDHLARNTEAAVLLQESLVQLGVWKSNAWWSELPDEDLSAEQKDRLRWQTYQVLTALNTMYVSRMVAMMSGNSDGGSPSSFRMLRSYLSSTIGIEQAKASMELTRRIETFRPSQAARWLGSLAAFRINGSRRVEPGELGPPDNPADGLQLAIFSLIASVDEGYRNWFGEFGQSFVRPASEDPAGRHVRIALETLRRVSDKAVDHHWIRLTAGQTYFLMAQQAEQNGAFERAVECYELSRAEYGRCIAIRPDAPFGYADRSTVALQQGLLMKRHPRASDVQRRRAEELLLESLRDANQAQRRAADQHWVYWHVGAIAAALDRIDAANEAFFTACELGFDVEANLDTPIVRLDDLQGRADGIRFAYQRVEGIDQLTAPNAQAAEDATLVAALEYSRGDLDAAGRWAETAIRFDAEHPQANRIAGWCALRSGAVGAAETYLNTALAGDENHPVSLIGAAKVAEQKQSPDIDRSEALYRRAIETARSIRHRSAAWFGIAKQALRRSEFDRARAAIDSARQLDPACDLAPFYDFTREQARQRLLRSKRTKDAQTKAALRDQIGKLKSFIDLIAELPQASVKQIVAAASDDPPSRLPLLNGGFELPLDRYWTLRPQAPGGGGTSEASGGSPPVRIDSTDAASGASALVIERVDADRVTGRWVLEQTIPATTGHRHELIVWLKSETAITDTSAPTLAVRTGGQTIGQLRLTGLERQWHRRTLSFEIPAGEDSIKPLTISLQVPDPVAARLLIDDVEIAPDPPG